MTGSPVIWLSVVLLLTACVGQTLGPAQAGYQPTNQTYGFSSPYDLPDVTHGYTPP